MAALAVAGGTAPIATLDRYGSVAEMVADEAGAATLDDVPGRIASRALGDCPSGTFTNEWFCLFEHASAATIAADNRAGSIRIVH